MKDTDPHARARPGWADTWMLSAHAKHPNCAYMWMKWVSTPKVQAQQAISFGETPANKQGVPEHGQDLEGLVRPVPRQRPGVVLRLDQVLEDADRRTAATARTTAPTTASGSRSGRRSRGRRWQASAPTREQLGPQPRVGGPVPPAVAAGRAPAVARRPRGSSLIYLAALVVLFISAFWRVDSFTRQARPHAGRSTTSRRSSNDPTYRTIALRTIGIAAAVTVTDALARVPVRVSSPRGWRRTRLQARCSWRSSSRCGRAISCACTRGG